MFGRTTRSGSLCRGPGDDSFDGFCGTLARRATLGVLPGTGPNHDARAEDWGASVLSERPVDFDRPRPMECPRCGVSWEASAEWLDRWECAEEGCPGCGALASDEDAATIGIHRDDPVLNDEVAIRVNWYHTTTHADWPRTQVHPLEELDEITKRAMGPGLPSYEARIRGRALHLGCYEAAIENMLRRIRDQADGGRQFYLYRVRLVPTCRLQPGCIADPADFVGDVDFAALTHGRYDVVRYANTHEAAASISLAITRSSVARVQRLAIPIEAPRPDGVERRILERIASAAASWAPPVEEDDELTRLRREVGQLRGWRRTAQPNRWAEEAGKICAEWAETMPASVRDGFRAAITPDHEPDPAWVRYALAMADLIQNPHDVLGTLDLQEWRDVTV